MEEQRKELKDSREARLRNLRATAFTPILKLSTPFAHPNLLEWTPDILQIFILSSSCPLKSGAMCAR